MTEQLSLATAGASGTGQNNSAAGQVSAAPRQVVPVKSRGPLIRRKWELLPALAIVGVLAYLGWKHFQPAKLPPGFASSNGRIEATEIDVAAKIAGRIISEVVDEGHFVTAGQVVAYMDTDTLQAQRREAEAKKRQAKSAVESAKSTVAQRESEKAAAQAVVVQRETEFDLSRKNLARAEELVGIGGISKEEVDTRRSALASAKAAVSRAKADVAAADAAIATAKSMVVVAESSVAAAQATIERIQADIDDSALKAPRGRPGAVSGRPARGGGVRGR